MNHFETESRRGNNFLSIPVLRRERAEIIRNNPYLELDRNMNALRGYHSLLRNRPLTYEENEVVFILLVRRLELEYEIRMIQAFFRRHS